jgi:hypothetical protein
MRHYSDMYNLLNIVLQNIIIKIGQIRFIKDLLSEQSTPDHSLRRPHKQDIPPVQIPPLKQKPLFIPGQITRIKSEERQKEKGQCYSVNNLCH